MRTNPAHRKGSARLPKPQSSKGDFCMRVRDAAGTSIAAAAFLFVTGIGAVSTYVGERSDAAASSDTSLFSSSRSELDDEMLARLKDYIRSVETKDTASMATAEQLQPDVDTMIDGLAARLAAAPDDIKGWKMLGWSYSHTGRYQEAADAYAKALKIDPSSAALKLAYEEARTKTAESDNPQTDPASRGADQTGEGIDTPEPTPSHEGDATARTMVDRLAHRLESSPQDVDGWTLLMRCRVVLGEREVASAAFRRALTVFRNDTEASNKITAAASALGLKAE
jgi:tetratricopeptide (TPR) repeat protein